MRTEKALLAGAVLAATEYCPLITRHAVKAVHGEPAARLHNFDEAIRYTRELLAELENVRTVTAALEKAA